MPLLTPPPPTASLLLVLLFSLLHPFALCRHSHPAPPLTKQPTAPPNSPANHPPVPPSTPWRHHVFLNFRGPDVRRGFADHLYQALIRKGIKAFRDDRGLPRGQRVTDAITRAIEDSNLSIVVLSRGYASSEFCLDELVNIMQTMKEKGHQPFPVFYNLSPDDVADHQSSGCYKDDFDRHKRRYSYERVESWSRALTSIAQIAGWELSSDRSEAEMVEKIANNMQWKAHEITSGVIRQSIRRFETGKQQLICENGADDGLVRICGTKDGESNIGLEKVVVFDHSPTTTSGESLVSHQPGTEVGPEVSSQEPPPKPAGDTTTTTTTSPSSVPSMEAGAAGNSPADPENEVGNAFSCNTSTSDEEEENITVEHDQQYQAPAPSKAAATGDEDDHKKRRLKWMSRTCTNSNQNDQTRHHEDQRQQQLKFIKPEITSVQGKETVRIPKTVAQEEIKKFSWDLSLIAQQISNTSPHHQNTTTIRNEANKLWNTSSPSSSSDKGTLMEVKLVGTARNGLYIFTFSNENIRDHVLESSPWCIANTTFVMRKWQPNLQLATLVRERSSAIPVWVRLVGVPVEYMNAKGLSYVASVLGKPLYMDRATASRTQLAFAKVCVEMRLSREGVTTIVVALGGGDGGSNGVVVVVVRVFYQWRPCMCTSCQPTAETT